MHIVFTETENQYIVKEPFNWHVSEDVPKELRESIEKKLLLLQTQDEEMGKRMRRRR